MEDKRKKYLDKEYAEIKKMYENKEKNLDPLSSWKKILTIYEQRVAIQQYEIEKVKELIKIIESLK